MNGFTIYKEYYELITLLSDKEQEQLVLSILKYMFEDIEPNLNERQTKIFNNLKRPLMKSKEQSKRATKLKPSESQKETKSKPNENQNNNQAKTHQDVNVIVNVNNNKNNNIYDFIQENLNIKLYPVDYELINTWEDNELTRYAIKQACLNRAFSTKYVDRILKNYESKNIKTVSDAINDDKKFQAKKGKNKQQNELPKWLDQKITDEELSEKEKIEFEKTIEEFK